MNRKIVLTIAFFALHVIAMMFAVYSGSLIKSLIGVVLFASPLRFSETDIGIIVVGLPFVFLRQKQIMSAISYLAITLLWILIYRDPVVQNVVGGQQVFRLLRFEDVTALQTMMIWVSYAIFAINLILFFAYDQWDEDRKISTWIWSKYWKRTNPFIHAAMTGDLSFMDRDPAELRIIIKTQDSVFKRSALHWASKFGHEEFVQRILLIDPQLQYLEDGDMSTPLFLAVDNKQVSVVRLLVAAGSLPLKETKYRASPLSTAIQQNDLELVKILVSNADTVRRKSVKEFIADAEKSKRASIAEFLRSLT